MTTITCSNGFYSGFTPSGKETPRNIWVGADGKLFIFKNVILDESLDGSEAFMYWYENNNIQKYTEADWNDISWGHLDEPKCEIVEKTWITEGYCGDDSESDSDSDKSE